MKISTITSSAKTGEETIDVKELIDFVEENKSNSLFISIPNKPRLQKRNPDMKIKKFKNQVTIGVPHIDDCGIKKNITIKVFSNGTLHITGCNSIEMINLSICKIVDVINKALNKNIEKESVYLSVNIFMINTTFDTGFKLNQETFTEILTDKYNILSIFSPKEYAGIKSVYYTEDGQKTSFLIFQSGKVTVAGSKDLKTLESGYKKINEIINIEKDNIIIN